MNAPRASRRLIRTLGGLLLTACAEPDTLTWGDDPRDGCSAEDEVDVDDVDANCDGVDGVLSDILFVSLAGRTRGDGTREDPLSVPQLALQRAKREGKRWVFLATGDYEGPLTLVDGVSIAGGYDPETWRRHPHAVTRVTSLRSPAITARDLTEPTLVQHLHVEAPHASEPSGASIALHVVDSGDALTWRGGSLRAGRGEDAEGSRVLEERAPSGVDGTNKISVCNWLPHQTRPPCADEHDLPGAEAVDCPVGGRTGAGGRAGKARWHRTNPALIPPGSGLPGASASNGAAGGDGGLGAEPVIFRRVGQTCEDDRGSSATRGGTGEHGVDGEDGLHGDPAGTVNAAGEWIPRHGQDGTDGTHGGGGGGGGAGPAIIDADDCSHWAPFTLYAPGGAGGSGGCGGQGGEGGGSGGASIAALAVRSELTLQGATLTTDAGGHGTEGAPGQGGGSQGKGGRRVFNNTYEWVETGFGGRGGNGGDGGAGGDGAGGSSVGVLVFDGDVLLDDVTFDLGTAGDPPEGSPAPAGRRTKVLFTGADEG